MMNKAIDLRYSLPLHTENAHLNSEGGSFRTADLLVLTGEDKVVLKFKKNCFMQ